MSVHRSKDKKLNIESNPVLGYNQDIVLTVRLEDEKELILLQQVTHITIINFKYISRLMDNLRKK